MYCVRACYNMCGKVFGGQDFMIKFAKNKS